MSSGETGKTATAEKKERARRKAGWSKPGFEGRRELVPQLVDNEIGPGRHTAMRNVRHDVIEQLYHRKVIGKAQRRAGHYVRGLVEQIGLADARSIAYDAIRVDGGAPKLSLAEHKLIAGQRLAALMRAIGGEAASVTVRLAGFDEPLGIIGTDFEETKGGAANGACSPRTRDYCSRLLRTGLMRAAIYLGYASEKERDGYRRRFRGMMGVDARPAAQAWGSTAAPRSTGEDANGA